jgi:hypothetical protein
MCDHVAVARGSFGALDSSTPNKPMAKSPKSKRVLPEHVCQFLIVLPRTEPLVWRRIQVPEKYSFWDLHVAIQDAMGWKDYHLHEFVVVDTKTSRVVRIGIPDDETPDEQPCLAGWTVPIARYLTYGPIRSATGMTSVTTGSIPSISKNCFPSTRVLIRAAWQAPVPARRKMSGAQRGTRSSCTPSAITGIPSGPRCCGGLEVPSTLTPSTPRPSGSTTQPNGGRQLSRNETALSNIQLEPTRPLSRAIMSPRRAAQLAR